MSIITVVMLTAFSIIYIATWRQVHQSIDGELHRSMEFTLDSRTPPPEGMILPPDKNLPNEDFPERSVSFSLLVDSSQQVVSVYSFYEEDADFYEEAFQSAREDGSERGEISFADSRWAYTVTTKDSLLFYSFVDIDERLSFLSRLLLTFIAVGGGTLLLIFLVSYYLTQRSLKPAEEAFARQKEFISHASHELKTPLAVIGANTELLAGGCEEEKPTAEQAKRLEFMNTEVTRMSTLIRNLLFLASVDEGSKETKGKALTLQLSEVLESHLLGMEGFVFEKGFSLEYTLESGVRVEGDAQQLLQVLSSLIDNAVKYGRTGSVISVGLKTQGGKALLEVSNTGEGIPVEEREKIFDRFYRGDKARSRTQASYGLGLSIARTIIIQHHGTISVSGEGGLTTFTVRLPLSR